ncbi:DJ-1/PfpI family protein, partial [Candidatus Micrarchaeota archaeon]|nr:DJ-1/PfpI family protein [Candidatus Micrarchaeota archaeon]MBU1166490.1 DJ-1/PfpI family protein [Candidatus Micrarchaeota archaeon]MBU1887205.1 DJ-1/PfpI family protein [Candidatus Micrarchaeota archaeon]
MAKLLFIVAQTGFKDSEYLVPREILEKEGHNIKIASITRAKAKGVDGLEIQPDMSVHEANPDFFDAIIVIGGPGSVMLAENEDVIGLLQGANKHGKVIAAICLAPMALANAGILTGKKATVFPNTKAIMALKGGGARYMATPFEVDGNIVTADSPQSAGEFGTAIAQLLKK